jgi:hypothetical protein
MAEEPKMYKYRYLGIIRGWMLVVSLEIYLSIIGIIVVVGFYACIDAIHDILLYNQFLYKLLC